MGHGGTSSAKGAVGGLAWISIVSEAQLGEADQALRGMRNRVKRCPKVSRTRKFEMPDMGASEMGRRLRSRGRVIDQRRVANQIT